MELVRRRSPNSITRPDIVEALGEDGKVSTVGTKINEMINDGRLERVSRGTYRLGSGTPPAQANGSGDNETLTPPPQE
jgi:hypothetical protein